MGRLHKFWSLSRRERQSCFEAAILLVLANLCVRTIAFRHIYRFLNAYGNRRARGGFNPDDDVKLVNLSLSRSANLLPWQSLCLIRSIAAFIMLRRRGIPAVMFVGARLEDSSLLAHAWVRTDRGEADPESENSAFTALVRIGQPCDPEIGTSANRHNGGMLSF
jgi:Transglutaminase-like superfamily